MLHSRCILFIFRVGQQEVPMSNARRKEIKGAEIRQLADLCSEYLGMVDPNGFGICWESDANKLNRIAEILGVPYRISNKCDTRKGPELINIEGTRTCIHTMSR